MAYRNITVNGKTYNYVIGKANIYIKGLGAFSKNIHGNPVFSPGCSKPHNFVATPRTVKAIICGEPTPVMYGTDIRLMVDPFAVEIYGKVHYLPYNVDLYNRLADDI